VKRIYFTLAIVGIVFLYPGPVRASILSPTADGKIIDGYVFNVGFVAKDGAPDQVDPLQSVQVLNTSLIEERGIVEFNVSGFNDPLTSAYLKLSAIDQLGPYPLHFALYGYQGNGALNNADFNDGFLVKSFTSSGENSFVFDVSPFLKDIKSAQADFAGFNIRLSDVSSNQFSVPYVAFGSLEDPPAAQLFLNESPIITPEPAASILYGFGGLPLAAHFFRRRKKVAA
jgi:hypothetical protein